MAVKMIQTDKAPAAIGPYSQAILSGGMLFVSGQLGSDPVTGEFTGNDFASQTKQALKNIGQIVEQGGFKLSDVTSVDVFLTDMDNFPELNRMYADFFSDHHPARAVVEVSALPKAALIEIKCVAVRQTPY